ncbi:proline iminopeptidase [Marivirga tractuosa]|uniref:Proline-specific peptidase n=1 Tax=Marivirga tractuosa (strain ATCC 23168 / DSM 4126 / NBRC 15989 / NCIMB 1408 / VKM B-1430 / H-43) TaxID=643867 RepID=E4TVZ3_MARTH|nr:proline iminopeptidase-family hydrolase [Marivirga tractuosa]ADR23211.1 proline-specific peptidase [Marivirga tractuosa DSM 4126]BDD16115.1 proline iminopeptidase [Marivirga tractuosa]
MKKIIHLIVIVLFLFSCSAQTQTGLEPHEGKVEVEGGEIWYKVMGEGEGIPILTLHGGPGGTHRYFYQLSPQTDKRSLILFDQLGGGRSDYHNDTTLMTVDHFVEQVKTLKDSLGLEEFYLLGHSWGGALAVEYYLKYPGGIKGMILSSPLISTPRWEADADTLIKTLPEDMQAIIKNANETGEYDSEEYQKADAYYWSRFGLRTAKNEHPLDSVEVTGNGIIYNYMWGPSEFRCTGTLKDFDRTESMRKISVPTLFVTGEYDEARPQTVQSFSDKVPNSEFEIIEGAGHSTLNDNQEGYNKILKEFLKE